MTVPEKVASKAPPGHAQQPDSGPPRLADVQALFQKAVVEGDDAILPFLLDNSRTTRRTLFGVYAHAYGARLAEILRNEYPLLAAYAGDEAFSSIAESYVRGNPSRTPNARWFGASLPEYLGQLAKYAHRRELCELAAIERATSDAFDAIDAPILTIAELANYPPDAWPLLVLRGHPSVRVLELDTNTFAIWQSLKAGEAPPEPAPASEAQHLIVWRQDATPRLRVLPEEEAMMWKEAAKGACFKDLCEGLATFADAENASARAAGYLQGWIGAKMLSCAHLGTQWVRAQPAEFLAKM